MAEFLRNRGRRGDRTNSETRRWLRRTFALFIVVMFLTTVWSPHSVATASGPSPGGCVPPSDFNSGINYSGEAVCPGGGVSPDNVLERPSSMTSPWANNDSFTAACYAKDHPSNTLAYHGTYDNNFSSYEYVRTDSSPSCSTNVAQLEDNVGIHGDNVEALKSDGSVYTVTANFTLYFIQDAWQVCTEDFGASAWANVSLLVNDALWDNTQGVGVGAAPYTEMEWDSTNATGCSYGVVNGMWNQTVSISFNSVSNVINSGDTLIPRASAWYWDTAYAPCPAGYGTDCSMYPWWTAGYQHANEASGYYVVLDSIYIGGVSIE